MGSRKANLQQTHVLYKAAAGEVQKYDRNLHKLPQYTSFKYLRINLQQEKEVELKIRKAWNRWRELAGVM